jgi:hypothetical protein
MKSKAIYKTRCVDIEILNVGGFDLFIKHNSLYLYSPGGKRTSESACPTVCVTCAGAGTAKPSNWKNDKA